MSKTKPLHKWRLGDVDLCIWPPVNGFSNATIDVWYGTERGGRKKTNQLNLSNLVLLQQLITWALAVLESET